MNKIVITLFISSFFCFSCEKEEESFKPTTPTELTDSNKVILASVELGGTYDYQSFYSLSEEKELSKILRKSWDIRLSDEGVIFINTAVAASAAQTAKEFSSVSDTVGLTFKHDPSTLNASEVVISSSLFNYVVDRGPYYTDRLRKITYSITETGISITVAKLDNSTSQTYALSKGEALSFESGITTAYPKNNEWDLCFGQYIAVLVDGESTTNYSVTGVLTNPTKWSVAELVDTDFTAVTAADVSSLSFSSDADIIGHEWKTYVYANSTYTIHDKDVFILKHSNGDLYKLHFLDFYNNSGVKGSPKFEFQKLN